ncbi:hypothetical protein [Sorangium sp. So ce1024]|uniref:hypothetical protein n=1 Tax=unclassified Sorangium TaxID=2621164 RepID=UPI003EFF5A45
MLRRLRERLDRALSPRAPAPPDLAELEAPESGPPDDAPAPPGDDAVVVMPIEDAIELRTFAPRDVASVIEEYLHEAQLRGFHEVRTRIGPTNALPQSQDSRSRS